MAAISRAAGRGSGAHERSWTVYVRVLFRLPRRRPSHVRTVAGAASSRRTDVGRSGSKRADRIDAAKNGSSINVILPHNKAFDPPQAHAARAARAFGRTLAGFI